MILIGYTDVRNVCFMGLTFYRCSWTVAWAVFDIIWVWLSEVVPWAILCAVVVILGEALMKSR